MKGVLVIISKIIPSNINIRAAGMDKIRVAAQDESVIIFSGEERLFP